MFESQVQSRVAAFDQRHCQDGQPPIRDNGVYLFPDGAYRDCDPVGILAEPSKDIWQRSKAIVRYHRLRLEQTVAEFDDFKTGLQMRTNAMLGQRLCYGPPGGSEAVERLKELKAIVTERKKALAAAEKQLDKSVPEEVRHRQRMDEFNRQRCADFLDSIKEIEV